MSLTDRFPKLRSWTQSLLKIVPKKLPVREAVCFVVTLIKTKKSEILNPEQKVRHAQKANSGYVAVQKVRRD